MLLVSCMVVVLVVVTCVGIARPNVASWLVTVVSGLGWARVNTPVEGAALLRFDADHGVTTADLLSVLAVLLVLAAWVRRAHSRKGREPDETDDATRAQLKNRRH